MQNHLRPLVFLVSGLFQYAAVQAQTPVEPLPLLQAEQTSGFVHPRNRFRVECRVDVTGQLLSKIYTVNADGEFGPHQIIERTISDADLSLIQSLIQESTHGPYEYRMNPCDIGSLTITARIGGADLPLEVSPECEKRTTNLSNAAKQLVDWMQKSCNLRISFRSRQ